MMFIIYGNYKLGQPYCYHLGNLSGKFTLNFSLNHQKIMNKNEQRKKGKKKVKLFNVANA